jgi:hypothetical protein
VNKPKYPERVKNFFAWSDLIDHAVLRPLAHIKPYWELHWDHAEGRYEHEEDSFAEELNAVIELLAGVRPPTKYHDSEDRLAEHVVKNLKWKIQKIGNRWVGGDYASILEQGGFDDHEMRNLGLAASGRIQAAISHGQFRFDDMEDSHRDMLAAVLSIILYHRYCQS